LEVGGSVAGTRRASTAIAHVPVGSTDAAMGSEEYHPTATPMGSVARCRPSDRLTEGDA
jgi:hypothetical protein